jgi:hypothetical protein
MLSHDHNILLNQIIVNASSFSFKEVIPFYKASTIQDQILTIHDGSKLLWSPIDLSLNIIINNRLKDTDIYYVDGRVGLGRSPLFNYRVDIAVPRDTLMTAFHIGDGSYGFSMGNGTTDGFISEIVGIGNNENDTGLYFVGIAGNNKSSDIPLIILDGRNTYNQKLSNRPIFGVTSGDYLNYAMLLDASNNLKIRENIFASDVMLNNISLIKIIAELQEQIDDLRTKIT